MKVLAVLLAMIVPPLAYFSTIAKERQGEQRKADEDLERLERRVKDVRATQEKMQEFLEEDSNLSHDLDDYRITLPSKLATSDILRAVESAITQNAVQLTRFASRPATDAPPLQVVSIEAEVEGPQPAIALLLQQLGDSPKPGQRFLTVSGVTTSGARTSFVVTGYALPDPK